MWVSGPGGEPWEVYTVLADAGAELEGATDLDVDAVPAPATGGGCRGTDGDDRCPVELVRGLLRGLTG